MPTPVSAARNCLDPSSSAALDSAVAIARRRSHAQTTSLHLISSLLSPSSSPPILLSALPRARASRLHLKALDLGFSVALDRLPSSSPAPDAPPVSNSLMAAVKRSQANQRRHPDTFHLYQQHQSASAPGSPAFAGVRVELQQLVLAILDDPVVSRVFAEAGFRSCDVKLAILRPPPPVIRFPRNSRCPPLFLCNFAAGEAFGIHVGGEDCRRVGEVMARGAGEARNPMLVGAGAAEAGGEFGRAVERGDWAGLPAEIRGLRFVGVEREILGGGKDEIVGRMEELREGERVVLSVGDLRGLVEGREDVVDWLVGEIGKVLEERRGSFWVLGWSVNYESYLKFLSRFPMVDKDWNLQLLPITSSHRNGMMGGGLQTKGTRFVFC